jgi:hypothetical protein
MSGSDDEVRLHQYEKQLAEAEREYERVLLRKQGLKKTVDGLRQLVQASQPSTSNGMPTPQPPPTPTGPSQPRRGKAAAWEIFRANPAVEYTIPQLLQELTENGWEPDSANPEGVLRVTVRRLMEDQPELVRTSYGKYAYVPDEET